ncbi:hypothetical protein FVE85_9726 [Porphyridium purpureum]|uniref:Uncharacterized protein n=1 Tax=Porphyridium purpureum TaxID=35688 RepID=A0A5J4YJT6_PORPP|nr:hypothetical protein FVE85_9726 [Porphyridium purpureum]|eukprot:POR9413..scf246_12
MELLFDLASFGSDAVAGVSDFGSCAWEGTIDNTDTFFSDSIDTIDFNFNDDLCASAFDAVTDPYIDTDYLGDPLDHFDDWHYEDTLDGSMGEAESGLADFTEPGDLGSDYNISAVDDLTFDESAAAWDTEQAAQACSTLDERSAFDDFSSFADALNLDTDITADPSAEFCPADADASLREIDGGTDTDFFKAISEGLDRLGQDFGDGLESVGDVVGDVTAPVGSFWDENILEPLKDVGNLVFGEDTTECIGRVGQAENLTRHAAAAAGDAVGGPLGEVFASAVVDGMLGYDINGAELLIDAGVAVVTGGYVPGEYQGTAGELSRAALDESYSYEDALKVSALKEARLSESQARVALKVGGPSVSRRAEGVQRPFLSTGLEDASNLSKDQNTLVHTVLDPGKTDRFRQIAQEITFAQIGMDSKERALASAMINGDTEYLQNLVFREAGFSDDQINVVNAAIGGDTNALRSIALGEAGLDSDQRALVEAALIANVDALHDGVLEHAGLSEWLEQLSKAHNEGHASSGGALHEGGKAGWTDHLKERVMRTHYGGDEDGPLGQILLNGDSEALERYAKSQMVVHVGRSEFAIDELEIGSERIEEQRVGKKSYAQNDDDQMNRLSLRLFQATLKPSFGENVSRVRQRSGSVEQLELKSDVHPAEASPTPSTPEGVEPEVKPLYRVEPVPMHMPHIVWEL